MKLGIDFGTTRIVAAASDRGNYPLVGFEAPDGQTKEWFPPWVAVSSQGRLFGWDAWAVQGDPQWTLLRSVKRLLKDAGPTTEIPVAGQSLSVHDLITELLLALRRQLRKQSSLQLDRSDPLEVMIGVPANANTNQRFLTVEAFRAAGFHVLGMLNEPSAASIEFGHRDRATRQDGSISSLLVYDLGGGTFDASLVEVGDNLHVVIATSGVPDVGGDDFDEILAGLALETAGVTDAKESLSEAQWFELCEECRERKEALHPNTRKIVVDLERVRQGWGEASLSVADFYERCRPLIERTESVVQDMLALRPDNSIEALYVTGGGSELPAVARILRETFGRRVRRSAYMRSATAIGLAISADDRSQYLVRDRFARYFGVWREADYGDNVVFDILFPRGLELPRAGAPALRTVRSYTPVHNVGYFRYVECSHLAAGGRPAGDLMNWDEVRFPFDPALRDSTDLAAVSIGRGVSGGIIEEEYTCDSSGMVRVAITNKTAGFRREYPLGRWSGKASAAPPRLRRAWSQRHRESR